VVDSVVDYCSGHADAETLGRSSGVDAGSGRSRVAGRPRHGHPERVGWRAVCACRDGRADVCGSARELLQQIARSSLLQVAREFLNSGEAQAESPKEVSIPAARIFSSALRGITLLFGCVVIARVVLGVLPTNREVTAGLRDFLDVDPSLTAGALLIVCLFAVWIAVSEVSWRQMTAGQARMYLRSVFLKLHYADLRMIVRKRLKVRQQRLTAAKVKARKEGNYMKRQSSKQEQSDVLA
jgi:hypothetical protein